MPTLGHHRGVAQRVEQRLPKPRDAGSSPVPAPSLLLDLGRLSACCTDHALEEIYKALSDPPTDGIWTPHHDPYVSRHIEDVTGRGLGILDKIRAEVFERLSSVPTGDHGLIHKARRAWVRWSRDDFDSVREYLEGKAAADYTPEDWMLMVDWIVQRYLPDQVIRSEAEYLAVRAQIMGKVQANIESAGVAVSAIEHLAAVAPATMATAAAIGLNEVEQSILDFARVRAADLITDLGDRTRHRLSYLILDHEQKRIAGDAEATLPKLQTRLLDEFSVLNRDWRRIALTEVARDANEGYIAAMPDGARVRRVEAYADACPFCRKIHGMVFTVVPSSKDPKDGATEVWIGKSNVDRSSAPRKRVGDVLVERTPSELWWPAAGVQHPNCRGSWQRVSEAPPGVDQKFSDWLDALLATA